MDGNETGKKPKSNIFKSQSNMGIKLHSMRLNGKSAASLVCVNGKLDNKGENKTIKFRTDIPYSWAQSIKKGPHEKKK